MSVKELADDGLLTPRREEIIIEHGGKKLKFYANEIGFLGMQTIGIKGRDGQNTLALIVAESITDEQGKKFTYQEVERLKKETAEKFLEAALTVNKQEADEKK